VAPSAEHLQERYDKMSAKTNCRRHFRTASSIVMLQCGGFALSNKHAYFAAREKTQKQGHM
jgi:hypothetical protein